MPRTRTIVETFYDIREVPEKTWVSACQECGTSIRMSPASPNVCRDCFHDPCSPGWCDCYDYCDDDIV